jgi:hypothetical protein
MLVMLNFESIWFEIKAHRRWLGIDKRYRKTKRALIMDNTESQVTLPQDKQTKQQKNKNKNKIK